MNKPDVYKVWSVIQFGKDGLPYTVPYLATEEHLRQLQRVGLVSDGADEVIGMQSVADAKVAMLEKEMVISTGGLVY